jgi:cobalt/nickel transport system permease protein
MIEGMETRIIAVPLGLALTLAALLLLLSFAGFTVLRKKRAQKNDPAEAPDWSVPVIDTPAGLSSPFHSWAPAVKVGTLFLYCFLIVSLRSLPWCGLALLISLMAVHLAQIPWQGPLRRLAAMAGFLLMFLVIVPLTSPVQPGDTLLVFPFLEAWPFRVAGFILALTVVLKACAVALLMEPMLATAPLPVTLQGFTTLGVPPALIQMVLLSHRYIFVFQQEMVRMHRSMRARGFNPGTNLATLRTMGNCFGMLFIRSFERTERVFEAMQSRGFRGAFPIGVRPALTARDLVKGGIGISIGLLLLIVDRLFPVL